MSYVLMKVLESAPYRYDRGIKILTLGRITKSYDRIIENIQENDRVLDIGCGTGMLSFRAILKGAHVTGFDINPEMLSIAEKRAKELDAKDNLVLIEMGVAEIDSFEKNEFDIVMSGLCFSELSIDETNFVLDKIKGIIKSGGLLLIADEVKPQSILKRIMHFLIRIPLVIFTYILTQTTSRAISGLEQKVESAGYIITATKRNFLGNFIELVARYEESDV